MNHSSKEISEKETSPGPEKEIDFQMQVDLMQRAEEVGIKPEDWADKYAEIYRKIITENPSLIESYRDNKEEALKFVEKLLKELGNRLK